MSATASVVELSKLSKAKKEAAYEALWARALAAGDQAGAAHKAQAMVVGTPKDVVGSLLGGDGGGFDENEPTYYVASGVCGFAWVAITPATSSFARWVAKNKGARKGYYGGLEFSIRGYGQSYEKKLAAAQAMAAVLQAAGVSAYAGSRLD